MKFHEEFINQSNEKDDKSLLEFANYIFRNKHSRSRDFIKLIDQINTIDPNFIIKVASKKRFLAESSAILSDYTPKAKKQLMVLMNENNEKIKDDITPQKLDASYSNEDYESDFEADDSSSYADLFQKISFSGTTNLEGSDLDLESVMKKHATVATQKYKKAFKEIFNPSLEAQCSSILNILHYIKSSLEPTPEYKTIIKEIGFLCRKGLVNDIKKSESLEDLSVELFNSKNKQTLDNLYTISKSHRSEITSALTPDSPRSSFSNDDTTSIEDSDDTHSPGTLPIYY